MNIPRYTLPVVVAAGLHGALFLTSYLPTTGTPYVPPVKKPSTVLLGPSDPVEPPPETLTESEHLPVSKLPTGGEPRPELPDMPTITSHSDFAKPEITRSNMSIHVPGGARIGPFPGDGGPGIGGFGGDLGTLGVDQLDRAPNARVQRAPEYPASLKQQGVSGTVVVEFSVDREGRVATASAVRYTHREFVEPALRAVKTWRFEPGKKLGRPVAFRMMIPIEFGIEN